MSKMEKMIKKNKEAIIAKNTILKKAYAKGLVISGQTVRRNKKAKFNGALIIVVSTIKRNKKA